MQRVIVWLNKFYFTLISGKPISQESLGKLVSECQAILDFAAARDDVRGIDDNRILKQVKLESLSTFKHSVFTGPSYNPTRQWLINTFD